MLAGFDKMVLTIFKNLSAPYSDLTEDKLKSVPSARVFASSHPTFGNGLQLVGGAPKPPAYPQGFGLVYTTILYIIFTVWSMLSTDSTPQTNYNLYYVRSTSPYTMFLVFPSRSFSSVIALIFSTEVTLETPT